MTIFSTLWDTEVRALAEACVTEHEFVRLMHTSSDYEPSEEEKLYLKEIGNKYYDSYGILAISDLIWNVEHDLADGRESLARLPIINTYAALNSPDYLENVFKGNDTCEEWKLRMALRDGLKKMMIF